MTSGTGQMDSVREVCSWVTDEQMQQLNSNAGQAEQVVADV
jgi:hypothetical protein